MTPDIVLLQRITSPANGPELTYGERKAFTEMLGRLLSGAAIVLSAKQRAWAREVDDRLRPFDIRKVPRGREVTAPEVLRRPLPMRPPTRKAEP